MKALYCLFICTFIFLPLCFAEGDIEALKKEVEELKVTVEELKKIVSSQEVGKPTIEKPSPIPQQAIVEKPAAPSRAISQTLNPNISIIGDFVGNVTDEESNTEGDRFSLREAELGIQAVVDPYARADFFIGVEEETPGEYKVDLEEGYITALTLPWDLQAKAGKFYQNFGKVNRIHRPETSYVDSPNILTNYFGEESRLKEPGISISSLIPNPWDKYMELTLEILNGENAMSFAGSNSRAPAYLAHLKNFFDITEDSTIELGFSGITGFNDERREQTTNIEGIDLTFKWRPLKEGLYKSFQFQNEFFFSQREESDSGIDSFGFYSFAKYQLARRWFVGGRYDYSEFPASSVEHEWAVSPILEFWMSEFNRLRLQYKHTDRNFGSEKEVNEVFLQWTYTLGPHRPEPY